MLVEFLRTNSDFLREVTEHALRIKLGSKLV
jgi:hypothetical protein